jgi:hypothetical protein
MTPDPLPCWRDSNAAVDGTTPSPGVKPVAKICTTAGRTCSLSDSSAMLN